MQLTLEAKRKERAENEKAEKDTGKRDKEKAENIQKQKCGAYQFNINNKGVAK